MDNLLKTLENYYANLLIIQYHEKPKAIETIKMLVRLLWVRMTLIQIRDAFNWLTAEGEPLDFIGKWVGVDRYITKSLYDGHSWFSLIEVSGATSIYQGGFSEVSNFNTEEGGFLEPYYVAPYGVELPDDQFRYLIGLKIIKNNIRHYCKEIDDAIHNFPLNNNDELYTEWDLANKQLIYHFPSAMEELMEVALAKGVLPCPMTCSIKLEEY